MRELYSVTQELKALFSLNEINDFGEYIIKSIEKNEFHEVLTKYVEWLGDDKEDWIQAVYQYNQADRKNLKQDYTPKCLSSLIAQMIQGNPKTIYDVCCGSGSLTLEVHKLFPEAEYILHELDTTVIPYLLLNLSLHNINATVINGDVLTGEIFKAYKIEKNNIRELDNYQIGMYDVAISNPPFNLPKDGNAKFWSYLTNHSIIQSIIILYMVPIKTQKEKELMKAMLEQNLLNRIIYNPEKMFTSTPTKTVILEVLKNKKNMSLYLQDCSYYHDTYVRHQNGQWGGNSHTGRTYHKVFNSYNEEQIEEIAKIWRGPRTLEWRTDTTRPEEIPLNLMEPDTTFSMLYGDSEEIKEVIEEKRRAAEEKQRAREKKQQAEYEENMRIIARQFLALELAAEYVHKKIGLEYLDKEKKLTPELELAVDYLLRVRNEPKK